MNCPSCNKFASLEMGEVEVESLEVEHESPEKNDSPVHTYIVTGQVRIVRTSVCCGDEMKEATFDLETTVEVDPATDGTPADLDFDTVEVEESGTDTVEEGGGRYAKSYFGATVEFTITIGTEGKQHEVEGSWTDKVAASGMDEV